MAALSALEGRQIRVRWNSVLFWSLCLSFGTSLRQLAGSFSMCCSEESMMAPAVEPKTQKSSALRQNQTRRSPSPRIFWLDPQERRNQLSLSHGNDFHLPEAPLSSGQKVAPLGGPCPYCEKEMNPFKENRQKRYYEECTPMVDWQTNFYPVCNQVHEVGLFELSSDARPRGKGWWRSTWSVSDPVKSAAMKVVRLKRSQFDHHAYFRTRIEAVSMEKLTASPHVVSMFGFCALTMVVELGEGLLEDFIPRRHPNYVARLEVARDLAEGLRDIDSLDYPNSTKPTLAHNDIKWGNLVMVDGHPKWNDFNDAVLMRWNKTRPCDFHMKQHDEPYRAPERTDDSSKSFDPILADIYTFGNILIYLRTNKDIWYETKTRDDLPMEQIEERQARGELPYIPSDRWKSTDTAVQSLLWATVGAVQTKPEERLTSHELTEALSTSLSWVKEGKNVSQSELKQLFSKKVAK